MTSRLSRGIITSISLLAVITLSTGCSSTPGYQDAHQDGFKNAFIKGLMKGDPSSRPWDPPAHIGYGARVPNMEGDWKRFCEQDPAKCG